MSGQRFDADYVQDDDYSIMNHSEVTQIKWVKSLDTTGFRDFCFDKKNMTFGQINLFYGANGSGKTSVLEKKKLLSKQGIGLGLPLAKAIVEAHNGTIEVDSELGIGTTFTMNFLIPTKL